MPGKELSERAANGATMSRVARVTSARANVISAQSTGDPQEIDGLVSRALGTTQDQGWPLEGHPLPYYKHRCHFDRAPRTGRIEPARTRRIA